MHRQNERENTMIGVFCCFFGLTLRHIYKCKILSAIIWGLRKTCSQIAMSFSQSIGFFCACVFGEIIMAGADAVDSETHVGETSSKRERGKMSLRRREREGEKGEGNVNGSTAPGCGLLAGNGGHLCRRRLAWHHVACHEPHAAADAGGRVVST